MKQLLQATLYRVRKTRGILVAFAIIYIAAILYFVFAKMIACGQFDATQAGSITGLGDAMIIWLFGSLIIGMLIGNDFENKTVHAEIKFGRGKIIANYMLVFIILVCLMVLPYTIASLICIIGNVDMTGAEGTIISIYMSNIFEYGKEESVLKLICSYISYAIVYIGQLSICIPVALKIKKTVVVTAFGFFFGMITALLATLASKVEVLDNIYQLTPYRYGIDKIGVAAGWGSMCIAVLVSACFAAIMGYISWLIFRKSDIK